MAEEAERLVDPEGYKIEKLAKKHSYSANTYTPEEGNYLNRIAHQKQKDEAKPFVQLSQQDIEEIRLRAANTFKGDRISESDFFVAYEREKEKFIHERSNGKV